MTGRRWGLGLAGGLVLGVQFLAAMHARAFLFFGPPGTRTTSPESIGVVEAASVLLLGPTLPRPVNTTDPMRALQRDFSRSTVRTTDGLALSLWTVEPAGEAVGTVLLLHGYGGCRDELLPVAEVFLDRDLRVVLLDQRGAGDSDGRFTTLGYREAEDVAAVARSVRSQHAGPLVAYGFSMGAVAALGAAGRENAHLDGVIAEAPYASLVDTVGQRFEILGLPATPGAQLLTFWGSVWAGFWAFDLRPVDDAEGIDVPTLVMSGALDRRAPPTDGAAIVARLGGPGVHTVLPGTGHQLGLSTAPEVWTPAIDRLLTAVLAER